MLRVEGPELTAIRPYFKVAAQVAKRAKCERARCGAIIIKGDVMLGQGFNGPPLGKESDRTCLAEWDRSKKPKYDLTCCIHAEWRAIVDAAKKHGDEVLGSRLYFMRVDDQGQLTDAGVPCCTVCSRLTMEAGIAEFALWNNGGADIYAADEYDRLSFDYFRKQ